MEQEETREILDRTPGYVNQLAGSMEKLAEAITHQGSGLGQTIQRAAGRISDSLDAASQASERHAAQLATWTKVLAGATIALVLVTVAHVIVALAR